MQTYSAPSLQRGYGMAIYRGRALQRGHGLGGLFKGLFRIAAPIIKRTLVPIGKRALKAVGKRALEAGAHAVKDIVEDKVSVKDALINRSSGGDRPAQLYYKYGYVKEKGQHIEQ